MLSLCVSVMIFRVGMLTSESKNIWLHTGRGINRRNLTTLWLMGELSRQLRHATKGLFLPPENTRKALRGRLCDLLQRHVSIHVLENAALSLPRFGGRAR
jgi:hypothetical protein